jgi:two-component system, NtrC family, sensor kinase
MTTELHRDKMAQLGELTVGIAHELNNSIGYVGSNLGSLRRYSEALVRLVERVDGHLPPEARERWRSELAAARWEFIRDDLDSLLAETQTGAAHLTNVVADLKILARSSPTTEAASIDACLTSALTVLAHQAKHRCQVERILCAPRAVTVVRSQVMQLVINLVLNALQALPASAGVIRLTTTDVDGQITLLVEDNGPGVPEGLRKRIFTPHFTTKSNGTGVGLSLAQQIARTHGGDISVERSADLGGACFRVNLRGASSSRSETQGA